MKFPTRTIAVISMVLGLTIAVGAQSATWNLSWSDEFTGSAIDTSSWNVENSTSGSYGGDAQAWRTANVVVANGYLSLLSKRESAGGESYTSGAVTTKGKVTFGGQDFRLEVRARVPRGQGVWPAIWTREGSMPNPDTGIEIDLMELLGQDPTRVYLNEHVWQNGTDTNKPASMETGGGVDFSQDFHTYAVEQSGTTLRWLIDGVQQITSSVVPTQPSYLLLNTSIGGAWPGEPTSSTPMPQSFDIDYVRLYTKGGTSTPADTTAPSVSVTAPTSGGTLSGTTTLTATASDNVGVTGVWFTVDGVTVGSEDAAAPYTTSWATTALANGVHVIRALARDAAGNIGTSTALSVTLNNLVPDLVAPTVSVTAPAGGSTVSGTVMLSASASDNVGVTSVQFTVDGVNVGGADTAAPYTYSWPTTSSTNGTRLVRAVARDAAGNTTTSSAVSVTVANTPADTTMPTATVTAPASGTTVSGTVSVTATATDNTAVAGVQFTLDGSALGSEDTTAPYAISWATTSATNGTHTLRAVARDPAGNTTTSGSVLVTVNNTTGDTTLPTVALTAPASGATVSGTTTVSASASDNLGVVGVQFTLDNVALGAEDTSAPYSISWATTGTANGPHTLRAIARDAAGNTRTATARTVTVTNLVADTSAPTVTVTAPAANATVAGSVTLTATATDDVGVVGVQFAVDGVNIGAEDTAAPYRSTWSAGTTLNGPHTLSATARDAAGNRRTATTVVTLRNLGSGVAGDLNDDRLPDLVFEHTTGQIYSWQMAAGTMTGGAAFAPAAVNPVWHIVALDDFDGDQKTDILWQNTVNGQVYLWLMDQYTLISEAWVLSADSPWRVMGTADLNGDGKPDILWKQPTTGALAVWYMDGATVVSTGALAPGQIDPNWRLAGTADLNHDGQPDLLWQNRATGALVYWLMHGPTAIQIGSVTPGATNVLWEVRAVADFDRDGQPDLLFQHATTGQLYLWYLNGTTLVRDSFVTPSQVDPNWKIVGGK